MFAVLALFTTQADFAEQESQWRAKREASLQAPTGWLAVSGLYWLKPGKNEVGMRTKIPIPRAEGTIDWLPGDKFDVQLSFSRLTPIQHDVNRQVQLDEKLGDGTHRVTFSIIHRGSKYGVRVWDVSAPSRKKFKGLTWFAPNPEYSVKAEYVAYEEPRQLPITNILGDTEPAPNPGYFSFTLKGKKLKLEAIDEGETYFLNFKDQTSGRSTYPAGRFIDIQKRTDGNYEINFNRAYNPPCAFTNFATCPLPPKANTLPIPIEVGEKTHHSPELGKGLL